MNIKKLAGAAAASAMVFSFAPVAPASAINNIQVFGVQMTLRDFGANTEIGYTVDGVTPSTDAVPFPVAGQLYESTVTAVAIQGTVTPVVPFFNARARNSQNYRVLQISTPGGLSGAPLLQGASTTGQIYFDVVGQVPNSVVYNNGFEDLLGWIEGAPPNTAPGGSPTDGGGGDGGMGAGPAEVPGSTGPNPSGPSGGTVEDGASGEGGGAAGPDGGGAGGPEGSDTGGGESDPGGSGPS